MTENEEKTLELIRNGRRRLADQVQARLREEATRSLKDYEATLREFGAEEHEIAAELQRVQAESAACIDASVSKVNELMSEALSLLARGGAALN